MAVNRGQSLQLNYDEQSDVLYASIDKPRASISVEIEIDILLRYVPPHHEVVAITIISFQKHFPCPAHKNFYEHAVAIVTDLLMKYPVIPPQEVS